MPLGAGGEREPLERPFRDAALSGARGRLDELGDRAGRAQLGIGRDVDGLVHRGEGLLVATETVVQDRDGQPGERQRESLPARRRIRR